MSQMPNNNQPYGSPNQMPPAPPRPMYRWRFRWVWVYVPLACLIAAAIITSVATPTFTWGNVMDLMHVHNTTRYTQLGVLGLAMIAFLIVLRWLLTGSKNR